jgi:hypothetical protein
MGHGGSAGRILGRAAGTVLLCAVPLLAGCSGLKHHAAVAVSTRRPASPPHAPRVPGPAGSPAAPGVPALAATSTLVTTVGQTIYSGGSLIVTLGTMVMRDHTVTAYVSYQNVGSSPLGLYCSGVTDPAIDSLTSANGTVIPASHSYCSDHPTGAINVPPDGNLASYAVFQRVHASSGPFTLTWQEGTSPSGSVSGITLG